MVDIGRIRVNRNLFPLFFSLLTLARFAAAEPETPVVIEVGTLSAEDGDGWMLSQIRSFEKAHPNIRIRRFAIGLPSRDEIRIEDLPELSLNVLGVRSDLGYEIGYLVDNGLIVPLERFLPDPDFRFEDFFSNVWDYVTYEDRRWGVPYLCSSVALIADWEVFKNSEVSAPPKDWEELLRILPDLTQDTEGDGAIDQYGFRIGMRGKHDTHMFFLWMTKLLQDGGQVMKNGRFDLGHPSLRAAYEFMDRLQKSPGARLDNRRFKHTAGDLSYRYGLQIAPSYYLNPLTKQHNYRIVPWVTSGEPVILDERRHYLCIARSTPEKERASWEFLKWIIRPMAPHPDGPWTFHLSARKDLLDRKDVRHKIESWSKGFDILHETKGWNVHHGDQVPGRFEAMTHLEGIVTALFHGELTFDEAMESAETECNAILDEFATAREWISESTEAMALRESGDGYWRNRDFDQTALAYLRLWTQSPQGDMGDGLRFRTLASLRNAGRFMEAEALATSSRPAFVANTLLEKSWDSSERTVERVEREPVQHSIHQARIFAASAFHGRPCLETLNRFFEDCRRLSVEDESDPGQWASLALFHRGLLDWGLRVRTRGEMTRNLMGEWELESAAEKEYAVRVAEDSIALASIAASLDPERTPLVFDALDFRMEVGNRLGDPGGVAASYRRVLDRFPDSVESPRYLFEFAHLLRNEVGDLGKAVEVCREFQVRHPEHDLAHEVRFQEALWLFEAKNYRRALPIFDSIAGNNEKDSEAALVLAALCRHALGEESVAKDAIRDFVRSHPGHDLAARAQGWLIADRIAEFRFFEASQMIRTPSEGNSSLPDLAPVLDALNESGD